MTAMVGMKMSPKLHQKCLVKIPVGIQMRQGIKAICSEKMPIHQEVLHQPG